MASGTGCSASAICVASETRFDVLISEGKALAFSDRAALAALFLCFGFLSVGLEGIGAVHDDAVVTIHRMSVEVFFLYC